MRQQNGAPLARQTPRRSRGAHTPPAPARVTETTRTADADELPTIAQLITAELRRLKLTAEANR
jgi:hypothetical protein